MKSLPSESALQHFLKSGNVVLQTRLFEPSNKAGPRKLMVISHPYGRLGGSWSESATSLASQVALNSGWYVAQYQSRGVSQSSGSGSFTGIPEGDDFQAVVKYYHDYLCSTPDSGVKELILAGCSAGSLSASIFPANQFMEQHPELKLRLLLISYPLTPLPFLTLYKAQHFRGLLFENTKHLKSILVMHGDSDQFTGISAYSKWSEGLLQNGATVVLIPGADHFWVQDESRRQFVDNLEKWL